MYFKSYLCLAFFCVATTKPLFALMLDGEQCSWYDVMYVMVPCKVERLSKIHANIEFKKQSCKFYE